MNLSANSATALFFILTIPAAAQDGTASRDVQGAMDRYREYLSRKPFHEFSLEKLVEAAINKNQLKDLVESYEKAWKEDPTNRANPVVLARLYARTGRLDEATKLLLSLNSGDSQVSRLLGEFYLKQNNHKAAIEQLEKAILKKEDPRFVQDVQRLRGKALLAAGEREKAVAAFRAIADVEPGSFNARLDVATTLAQNGLHDEAIVDFNNADQLAAGDASKRCRVLSEIGRLQETKLRIEDALATYRQALALMGRGNWLKKDIYQRILSIHKRSGSLEKLAGATRDEIQQKPQDLDLREFLAQICEESGKRDEARAVLEAAAREFPDDLKLSRHLIATLAATNQKEALIAEYQRVLGRHPEEIDLYLELGKIFAEDKRLEQAKIQWEKLFQQKIKDAELCLRLADLYTFYNMDREAVAMYEKAIELQPREIRHYGDLANYYERASKHADAVRVLDRAAGVAGESSSQLEQLSQAWQELKEPLKAKQALQLALAGRPSEPRLLSLLGDLQIATGEFEAGAESLILTINLAPEMNLRVAAVDRLIRAAKSNNKTRALVDSLRAKVTAGGDRASLLLLAKLATHERDFASSLKHYESVIAREPALEEAHRGLARIYEDQGDFDLALKHYQSIIDKNPQSRRQYLKEMARVHLAVFDQEKAFALYEEILKNSPDNPSAFKEVAEAWFRVNMYEKAAECLEQAVRLKPDEGRYRLDLANIYKKLSEPLKAKEAILAAIRCNDEDVRDDARKRYYEQLSEMGEVEEEARTLRKRIEENPYDVEAPLLLSDIYVREMEYQLALDMLDTLLTYQPEESKLLFQRSRILTLMERHSDAIINYEKLLKFPKSDRDQISLRIVEAAIQSGDLVRATELAASVRSTERAARIFNNFSLYDQAAQILERGVAKNPNDAKLQFKLFECYQNRGDREKAIPCLETILGLVGDDFETLKLLGTLYFDTGRRDESLSIGRRLFSAVRVDKRNERETDEARSSQYETEYSWWNSIDTSTSNNTNLSQVINEISEYYSQKSFIKEFGKLISTEALLQPRNEAVIDAACEHLAFSMKDPSAASALVDRIRAITCDRNLAPANFTIRSWRSHLDAKIIYCYSSDPQSAAPRILQLYATLGGAPPANATAAEKLTMDREGAVIELAALLDLARREPEAIEMLKKEAAAPDATPRVLFALGSRLIRDKAYAEAVPVYEKLLPLVPGAANEDHYKQLREIAWKLERRSLLESFPVHLRNRIREKDLRRVHEILANPDSMTGSGAAAYITKTFVTIQLATALARSEKPDGRARAIAILSAVQPRDEMDYFTLNDVLVVMCDLELFEATEPFFNKLLAVQKAHQGDPLLPHVSSVREAASEMMSRRAHILELAGRPLEAYDLLRTYGNVAAGELLLTNTNSMDAAAAEYHKKFDAALAEFQPADVPAAARLRDAGIRYADILQFQKKYDDAMNVYKSILAKISDDFEIQDTIAILHERVNRFEEAVAEHFAILKRMRELNRIAKKDDAAKPFRIEPVPPPKGAEDNESWIWQNLSGRYGYGYGWSGNSQNQKYNVREHYTAIVRIYLDRRLTEKATEVLRDLAREDMSTFRWMTWALSQIINNYNLGAAAIPILRLLYGSDPDNLQAAMGLAHALASANQLEEARRLLTIASTRQNQYYRELALRELASVEARLGKSRTQSLAEMRASVEREPKNIKQRMALAQRLFTEQDYAGAMEHSREAFKLAPHQYDVSDLYNRCIRVAGNLEDIKNEYKRLLQTGRNAQESSSGAIALANVYLYEKDEKAAEALLEDPRVKAGGSAGDFSLSTWFQERRLYKKAAELLESEIDSRGRQKNLLADVRSRQQRLKLILNDLPGAMKLAMDAIEEANGHGQKEQQFHAMVSLLRVHHDLDAIRPRFEELLKTVPPVTANIYKSAFALANGEIPAAEAALAETVKNDPKAVYLYPLRVMLARSRGDFRAALDRLDELEKLNPGSETYQIDTSAGSLTERNSLRAEKGSLLFKLGDKAAAEKLWLEMLDPARNEDRLLLATIYESNGLVDRAIEMILGYVQKVGERDATVLSRLAGLYLRKGDFEHALSWLGKRDILNRNNNDMNSGVDSTLDAWMRAGRLAEYYNTLKERRAKDPADIANLRALAQVARLMGDDAAVLSALETIASHPGSETSALPALADYYQSRGDFAKATATRERMLSANVNKWSREELHRKIALMHFRAGNLDRAREVLAKAYDDPQALNALQSTGGFFRTNYKFDVAIEYYKKAVTLDPLNSNIQESLGICYNRLQQHREALDCFYEVLARPDSPMRLEQTAPVVAQSSIACGERARIDFEIERAGATPAAIEWHLRAGFVAFCESDWNAAAKHLIVCADTETIRWTAAALLHKAFMNSGQLEEAVKRGPALIRLFQRHSAARPELQDAARQVRDDIISIQHELGKVDDAIREWSTPLRNPYSFLSRWNYTISREPFESANACARLRERGEYARALALFPEASITGGARWANPDYIECLYRSGERDRAMELAWRFLTNPTKDGGGYQRYYRDEDSDYRSAAGPEEQIIIYYAELNRMNELEKKVLVILQNSPDDTTFRGILSRIYTIQNRPADLLEVLRKDREKDGSATRGVDREIQYLIKLEKFEEALALSQKDYQRREAMLSNSYESDEPAANRGNIRFGWTGGASSGNYYYGSNWSSISTLSDSPESAATLAGLYFKFGKRDEALRIEKEALNRSSADDSDQYIYSWLAFSYSTLKIEPELVRIVRSGIEKNPRLAPKMLATLANYYIRNKDAARANAILKECIAEFDRWMTAEPNSRDQSQARMLQARTSLLIPVAGFEAQLLADADAIARTSPRSFRPVMLRGYAKLRGGDARAALALFEEADRIRLRDGSLPDYELEFGLGFALSKLQKSEEAAMILRRALTRFPEGVLADEARSLLLK